MRIYQSKHFVFSIFYWHLTKFLLYFSFDLLFNSRTKNNTHILQNNINITFIKAYSLQLSVPIVVFWRGWLMGHHVAWGEVRGCVRCEVAPVSHSPTVSIRIIRRTPAAVFMWNSQALNYSRCCLHRGKMAWLESRAYH